MGGPPGHYRCGVRFKYALRRASAAPYNRRLWKGRYQWRFQQYALYPFSSCLSQDSYRDFLLSVFSPRARLPWWVPLMSPVRPKSAGLPTVQTAMKDVTHAQQFLAPLSYSSVYKTTNLPVTLPSLAVTLCCCMCPWAEKTFTREQAASQPAVFNCGVIGAAAGLHARNEVAPCFAETPSVSRVPANSSFSASGAARLDLPSAVSTRSVPVFLMPAGEAEKKVSYAGAPLQERQIRPFLNGWGLSSVAHQGGCRRVSTSRQIMKLPPDINWGEQLHGEQSRCDYEDRPHGEYQQHDHQQRHNRDHRQQPHQHARQASLVKRQQQLLELHGPRPRKQRGLQKALSAPATGQQNRCNGQQHGEWFEPFRQNGGMLQVLCGWHPDAYEPGLRHKGHQLFGRKCRTEAEFRTGSTGTPRQPECCRHLHCPLEQGFASRLLAYTDGCRRYFPTTVFRSFSTSSELLARELQRRLSGAEKTGRTVAADYDGQRQGIVLAIADDILLVRGLAAAPVGTLVAFSHNCGGPSRMPPATVGGNAGQPAPTTTAATAAKGAPSAGNGGTAGETAGATTAGDDKREDKPALVLGVVLQLLQQDLNIIGLLGATSRFCSSPGEHLSFRYPCVGDLCTGVSAYDQHQQSQLQQQSPQQEQQKLQQSMHNEEGQDLFVPDRDGEQARKPYTLTDACLTACGSHAIMSPLTLLDRSVPVTATSDQTVGASQEHIAFLNALDLSQVSLPPPPSRSQTDLQLPWGLPTGSAVVDALAPLQVGEASAFMGPPGTGKTEMLVPIVALHAAAAAAVADEVSAECVESARTAMIFPRPSAAADTSRGGMRLQKKTTLSVVALAFGSSSSRLRRWLGAVSKEAAKISLAVCVAGKKTETDSIVEASERSESGAAAAAPAQSLRPVTAWRHRAPSPGDGTVASATSAASSACADCATDAPLHSLEGVVLLHVPAPHTAASEAAAGKAARNTDLRGYRIHPTSCLTYLAPVLALRLALEAQATRAAQGEPCPVLLVIDGLEAHAVAVEQLQLNIRRLLSSHTAGVNLPAGIIGLTPPAPAGQLPPGAASAYGAAAAAAVALPYSAVSLYGMMASRSSLSAGGSAPLSVLLVLDTPSDPSILTARNLQRSMNGLPLQQQQVEETLIQTVKRDDSVGVVLSHKLARQAEEALLSSVHRTVLFAMGTQQQGQHQGVAGAARKAVQQEQYLRQAHGKAKVETSWRKKNLLLDCLYPMIDIDSMVTTSTAALSADACMALSRSCFATRDGPTAEADSVQLETLRDAIKALCRRQLRAERQLLQAMLPSTPTTGAHTIAYPFQERSEGMKEARRRGQPVLEPPALLAVAAAAFAWQRRVLHDESKKQEMMQQLRLFVDVWEQEDVDSLSIASAICLARPPDRIFNPSEQLVLLRAGATLFFIPPRAREFSGEEGRERWATRACGAPPTSGGPGGLASGCRETALLSFARICAFQEDVLRLFREKEPQLWESVQQHLQRVGKWPMELHCDVLGMTRMQGVKKREITDILSETGKGVLDTSVQTPAEEEEQVDRMAQDVMYLLNRVDAALLAMRSYFDITAPYFPED